jgi:hypothetical protein
MMNPSARFHMVSLPLLVMLLSAPAAAQKATSAAQIAAEADEAFRKGKKAIAERNYKEACPAFLESYKLDPIPGALHALAVCHMEAGEIASAMARFDEYLRVFEKLPRAQKAKHTARAKGAKEQRDALAPDVPELTLVLPAQAPPGTRVVQDSVELSEDALGVGQPIDPGEHVVTTQAPGGPVKEHRFTIQKGEKKRLDLSVAEKAPTRAEAIPGPVVGGDAGDRDGAAGMGGYRVGAFVAGGIGAAALVGGIITGALAAGKMGAVDESCRDIEPGRATCSQEGLSAAQSVQSLGLISTIGFVVGSAGLATGTLLFFLDPSKEPMESHGRRGGMSIGVGLTSAGPSAFTAGVKGAW